MGEILPWSAFLGAMRTVTTAQQATKGAGLRILTETVCSPTLAAQIEEILARFPAAIWHQWDPGSELNAAAGLRMAAGSDVSAHYNVENAAVIVVARRRFLQLRRRHISATRGSSRAAGGPKAPGCRLYAAETMPTPTGAKADHRLPLRPSQIESLARALAADLGVPGVNRGGALPADAQAWLAAVRNDLNAIAARASSSPAKASRRSCTRSRMR